MATPTEPITDALYKALSSPEPDRVFRSQLADRHAGEGDLARDLAADHSVGRAYLQASLQGAYRLEGISTLLQPSRGSRPNEQTN